MSDEEDVDKRVVDDGWLSTEAGEGAGDVVDELIDESAIIENDGRSETRTTFYAQDVDGGEGKWARLAKLNDGVGKQSRAQDNRVAERKRDAEAFCSSMGMTRTQTERVCYLVEAVSFEDVNRRASVEEILIGLVSLVANEDGRRLQTERGFNRLREKLEVSKKRLASIRQDIREADGYT